MAPESERVLTVTCGSRVVAALWPAWSPDKFLVTALQTVVMSHRVRHVAAPCHCKARVHMIDLDKLAAVASSTQRRPGGKTDVAVTRVRD